MLYRLVVLKNNIPSAVILSPEEYTRLLNIEDNYSLLTIANQRLANYDSSKAVSYEEILSNNGLTKKDVENALDVEIG